jgi:hypothetical protein
VAAFFGGKILQLLGDRALVGFEQRRRVSLQLAQLVAFSFEHLKLPPGRTPSVFEFLLA